MALEWHVSTVGVTALLLRLIAGSLRRGECDSIGEVLRRGRSAHSSISR